jgi:hypothetical protein
VTFSYAAFYFKRGVYYKKLTSVVRYDLNLGGDGDSRSAMLSSGCKIKHEDIDIYTHRKD